jgi:drug/metabolite transporter (DMT)-like permease
MTINQKSTLGILFVLIFSILTAGKEVVSGNVVQYLSPFLLVFIIFFIIILFFQLNTQLRKNNRPDFKGNIKDLVLINIATVGGWLTLYHVIKYLEPAVASAVITATGPILTTLMDNIIRTKKKVNFFELFFGVCIISTTAVLTYYTLAGQSGLLINNKTITIIALCGAFISGVSVVATTVYSKKLYSNGWNAGQLMAHRFYLLLIFAFLGMLCEDNILLQLYQNWHIIIVLSIFGFLIPLYILQLGIIRTSPVIVASLISLSPCFAMIFQLFDKRIQMNIHSVTGILVLTIFIIMNIIWSKNNAA